MERDRPFVRKTTGKPHTNTTGFELSPEHPIVTIERVVDLLSTTKPTANKAVSALFDAGVLVEATGRWRNRTFGYAAYLDRLRAGTEI